MKTPLFAARNVLVFTLVFFTLTAFGRESLSDNDRVYAEAYEIFQNAQEVFYNEKQLLPDEEFFNSIKKHGFEYKDVNGYGKAILKKVGPLFCFEVQHYESNKVFIYADADLLDPNDRELQKLIAKIHIDKKSDAVLGRTKNQKIEGTEEFPRPKLLSPNFFREYWRSTYEKPDVGDLNLAMVCAVSQVAVSLCLAAGKNAILPEYGFQYEPAVLTVFFALAIGINSTTYKNWAYRGSWLLDVDNPYQKNWINEHLPTFNKSLSPKVKKELLAVPMILRQSIVSIAFAYTLTAWIHEDGIASMNNIWTHLFLLGNVGVRNYAKKFWYEIPKIRADLGLSNGRLKVKIPYSERKIDTRINKQAFEYQMMYLIPFGIGVLDIISLPLMNMMAEVMPVAGELISVVSSKATLFAMIPAAMYVSYHYTKRSYLRSEQQVLDDPTRIRIQRRNKLKVAFEEMEKRWEESIMIKYSSKVISPVTKVTRIAGRVALAPFRKCAEIFGRRD